MLLVFLLNAIENLHYKIIYDVSGSMNIYDFNVSDLISVQCKWIKSFYTNNYMYIFVGACTKENFYLYMLTQQYCVELIAMLEN